MANRLETNGSVDDALKSLGIVRLPLSTPFPVGPVNVFLIEQEPLILVDTGLRTEDSYRELSAGLKEHGYAISDLGIIIVTHGHRDHMGQLGRLLDESDAISYGHPLVKEQGDDTHDHTEARRQFYLDIIVEFGVPNEVREQANSLYDRFRAFSTPFKIDHEVKDEGRALDFTVYYVPGHSPSDTVFVNSDRGFSLTGDHILTATNPNPLLRRPEPGQSRAKSLVEYQHSLRRTRELDLGICCPGHGDAFDDHVSVVDRILERQETRSRQVLKLVRQGQHTPYAISRMLFPKLPMQHLHLGLSIAVGHLEVLEERGQLRSRHEGPILTFDLVG